MRLLESSTDKIPSGADGSEGVAYLIEEKRPRLSIQLCEKLVSDGASCMLISRDPPSQFNDKNFVHPKRTIWLTTLVGKDRMNPTAIGILMGEIRKFIDQSEHAVILLDGLEYLISINTYDRMLQFVHQLRDIVVMSNSILIMPIDTRTLSDRELALLERNLQVKTSSGDNNSDENLVQLPSGEIAGMSQR